MFNLNNSVGNILRGHSVKGGNLAAASVMETWNQIAGLFGIKTTADVYISALYTLDRVWLSLVPDTIKVKEGARFQSYNIIEKGEVKTPKGEDLTEVSWEGVFPGSSRKSYPFVKSFYWESPKEIVNRISSWKTNGVKLNLLVTQTPINIDVFVRDFSYSFSGGHGDASYSISFIAVKDLIIKTVEEVDAERLQQGLNLGGIPVLNTRATAPQASTAVVGAGGSLWSMAQHELGDGSRWQEIYELNKDKIADPDVIQPGMTLQMPTK